MCRMEGELVISKHVSSILEEKLDENQQYSRRSCLLISGIMKKPNERSEETEILAKEVILNDLGIPHQEFQNNFDKVHRVGKTTNNKQNIIIKFKTHSFREKLYKMRKDNRRGVKFHISLTQHRSEILSEAKLLTDQVPIIDYCFADTNGNLKVRLKEQIHNSNLYPFRNITELRELISSLENAHISDDFNNVYSQ